ncbi:hypothetical protein RFI_08283 [Reticulomyxa filosa]|uniref:Uncharacterized protein n=1 Tax=Reticulomyxa filosa TaxID=46433 RepID=X6NSC9_RETFI|nr:hypothetical protein RFI_08283 [Reticulomyxa filosa]|eukprot:ETO28843.1 hypothetical protein RFI_08283 [Reticulomyxa filosa]
MEQARIRICEKIVFDYFGEAPQVGFSEIKILIKERNFQKNFLTKKKKKNVHYHYKTFCPSSQKKKHNKKKKKQNKQGNINNGGKKKKKAKKTLETLIQHHLITEYGIPEGEEGVDFMKQITGQRDEQLISGKPLNLNNPKEALIQYQCDIDAAEMLFLGVHFINLIQEKQIKKAGAMKSEVSAVQSIEESLEGVFTLHFIPKKKKKKNLSK